MMTFFLQAAPDSLTQATQAVIENVTTTQELSLFEFVMKGGVFLIPIVILFIYTIYLTIERYLFIKKTAQRTSDGVMDSLKTQLNSGNLDLAIASVQRENTSEAKLTIRSLIEESLGHKITGTTRQEQKFNIFDINLKKGGW